MRVRSIEAAALLLLAATAVQAQAPQPTPAEARSPLSEMAHHLTNWLNHVTGNAADHPRLASPPPLPRARPPQPVSAPVVANERPPESGAVLPNKKAVAPVQIND